MANPKEPSTPRPSEPAPEDPREHEPVRDPPIYPDHDTGTEVAGVEAPDPSPEAVVSSAVSQ